MPPETLERIRDALAERYRVEREIGRGGMASVYLARDIRHDRDVAVKVLLPELAALLGRERFISEIRTTARLQHPHILPLLDSGEADGLLYFVTPYVAGESLSDRLARERQLPIEEAVRISKAVASALDHAHRNETIHRDVKPSNILMLDGEPVVADFGIALAVSAAGGSRLTETGLSLGTPHYMSPEQVTGDVEVGPASDVYSLGCTLYEMLVGDPPFDAPTSQAFLAKLLTEPPQPPSKYRSSIPAHVEATVLRALEKLPADRFTGAAAFASALDDATLRHPTQGLRTPGPDAASRTTASWAERAVPMRWAVTGVAAVVVLTVLLVTLRPYGSPTQGPPVVVELPDEAWGGLILSADGRWMASRPEEDGPIRLRRLDGEGDVVEIPADDEEYATAFSPDGRWLLTAGSFDGVHRIPTEGGRPVTIVEASVGGGDWSDDGLITYVGHDGLYTVPWEGGTPRRIVEGVGYLNARGPRFLPDGRHVLYTHLEPDASSGGRIDAVHVESGRVTTVVEDGVAPQLLGGDILLFARAGEGLYGVPFDVRSATALAPPVKVLDSVLATSSTATYAASDAGLLVARLGPPVVEARSGSVWRRLDDGTFEPLSVETTLPAYVRASPDGSRLAFRSTDGEPVVLERATGRTVPLPGIDAPFFVGLWHPSGDSVLALTNLGPGSAALVAVPADGSSGGRQILSGSDAFLVPLGWTRDGRSVLTQVSDAGNLDFDLVLVSSATGTVRPFLDAEWSEALASVSPDGQRVAYFSSESGSARIYVRAFPDPGPATVLSGDRAEVDEISVPQWAPDSRTVYWQSDEGIMATSVGPGPEGSVGETRVVVPGPLATGFEVDVDGSLLVTRPIFSTQAHEGETRTVMYVNWLDRIRAVVHGGR